jgi:8-oxo-dGTP pyrophosphatase MutT (NUDIX family)
MQNPWQTISTKTVYDNPWIKVDESKVINPSGNDGIYGVVKFKNHAIAIIPLDDEYYTWIVGQYRYTLDSYEWEIIEGGSPIGQDILEGAKRELKEETGIDAKEWKMIMTSQLSNSVSNEIGYTFIAKGLTYGKASPDETEKLVIRRLHFDQLFDMAMNGEIKDGLSLMSIFKTKFLIDKGVI